ncbi:nucleotidyltransferase family protein [Streptacidiphilus sp. P02-A3a]|uniref:nucleotidyltransferase domain-containing protein n=1 Tax=Streptacidiphilus sp. P02-A3a TaxID=2704468 RepID=UPI0015F9662C|nr:nucleotidyltransferase family protein [Streptacidiphilus sp. P02-A3a]QMU69773.1 nucleotidyltransferase family protein [Streptacidiphilus sp. P02-A3a]
MAPEITLICLLAKRNPTPDDIEAVHALLDGGAPIDWAYFLDQSHRHRVMALIAANADRFGLYTVEKPIPGRDLYRAHLLYQRERNEALLRELRAVLTAFHEVGLKVVPRKGAYLSWAVYREPEVRPMGDLDLMVRHDQIGEAEAVLDSLGYATGTLSPSLRVLDPLDRQTLAFWRIYTNNAPTRFRLTSVEQVQAYSVDLVHNLFLPRSGYSMPVDPLIDRAQLVDFRGAPFWALPPELHLVDIAAHLFKESTTISYINAGRHQSLSQFRDLAELIEQHPTLDWTAVVDAASGAGIEAPIYFALAHLNVIYVGTVPQEPLGRLHAAVERSSPNVLDEYGAVDLGQPARWRVGFLERMFERSRVRVDEESRSLV